MKGGDAKLKGVNVRFPMSASCRIKGIYINKNYFSEGVDEFENETDYCYGIFDYGCFIYD
ncbi:hypothetical protein GCM10011351_30750 [Paraliobacillus quinghaiensis]|uniref:Uncharacterized protein n=1 Tax=Paraliobacillus quinghaiensis TaxID=470815 RepID=A0A917TXB2_9BACI|nr:hypothetical protein GCM10011351_30750 [Paraliobacillus quinghaiensis]